MPVARIATLLAAVNVAYATSFLLVRPDDPETGGALASALLLAGGLLAVPVILALYRRLAPLPATSRCGRSCSASPAPSARPCTADTTSPWPSSPRARRTGRMRPTREAC